MDHYLESMQEENSKSKQPVTFGNLGNVGLVKMTNNPMVVLRDGKPGYEGIELRNSFSAERSKDLGNEVCDPWTFLPRRD